MSVMIDGKIKQGRGKVDETISNIQICGKINARWCIRSDLRTLSLPWKALWARSSAAERPRRQQARSALSARRPESAIRLTGGIGRSQTKVGTRPCKADKQAINSQDKIQSKTNVVEISSFHIALHRALSVCSCHLANTHISLLLSSSEPAWRPSWRPMPSGDLLWGPSHLRTSPICRNSKVCGNTVWCVCTGDDNTWKDALVYLQFLLLFNYRYKDLNINFLPKK